MGQSSVAMVGGIVLNPLSKYKILTYYNKALALKQGKMIPPRIAFIYPTYACNHNCPHCLYRGWNNGVHFPYDRLINLLEELYSNGVRGITLCGGGEPTLYPEFEGMVRHAKKLGIDLGLITNGSTLKKYGKFIGFSDAYKANGCWGETWAAGPNAWMLMALNTYMYYTNDVKYLSFIRRYSPMAYRLRIN